MYRVEIREGDVAVFKIDGREIEVSKMTISPERAKSIINHSDTLFKNRKTRKVTVDAYRKDMQSGEWKVNGETIKFREDGALTDGRHRLMAVSEGNTPVEFIAIGNLEKGVEDTMDIGMARSLESAFDFNDLYYMKGAGTVLKYKMKLDKGTRNTNGNCKLSGLTRVEMVQEFIGNIESYNSAVAFGKTISANSGRVLGKTEVGGIYAYLTLTMGVSESFVEDFFTRMVSAARNSKGIYNAAMTKLSKISSREMSKQRLDVFINCWNSHVLGYRLKSAKMNNDDWFIVPNENVVENTVANNVTNAQSQQ